MLGNFKSRLLSGNARTIAVKKNILSSAFLKGVNILTSFMLVPLTIGYVSSELYGIWLTLSSIMSWLGFFDIGFTQGLKNKLTEAIARNDWKRGKELVSTTYFMMIVIFVPICLLLELLVPHIHWTSLLNVDFSYEATIQKVMYALIAFFCIQMIINVIVSVVAAFQKVALSSSFNTIGQVLALIIVYILTKTVPPSLLSLAIAVSVAPIVVVIIASAILYSSSYKDIAPSFDSISLSHAKDIFSLGYKFFIINIQVVILYQSTNILISNVSSPLDVTSYNIAYKYLNVAMMVYTIITAPLWPAYTDAYVKKDFAWMRSVRNKMTKVFLLSAFACVVMLLVSGDVYRIWIGNKAVIPWEMTALVALYVIVYCWMNLNATILVGMGIVKIETILVVAGMVIHIPLSLFLSKYLGAYGVLISMIAINLMYAVVFNIQVVKVLGQKAKGIWLQ